MAFCTSGEQTSYSIPAIPDSRFSYPQQGEMVAMPESGPKSEQPEIMKNRSPGQNSGGCIH